MEPHEPASGRDADVELLTAPPALGRLLARATATAFGRPGARGSLPSRRVLLTGVEQDPARLAAYARVCGLMLRDRVPPTWLHVLTFPLQVHLMAARDFPFAMPGMVHVANRMTLLRPVEVGETLVLSSTAASLAPHRAGVTVDLLGEVRVGDEPVWRGTSTYLVRGQRLPGAAGEAGDDSESGEEPRAEGAIVPTAQWRLPAGLGRHYARVSGDVNPIHLNPLAARAFGFPRTIAHGMWTHARALAALDGRLPESYEVSVRFRKPVLLPSTVWFGSVAEGGGWRFAVTGRDGARHHLSGSIAPSAAGAGGAGADFVAGPGLV